VPDATAPPNGAVLELDVVIVGAGFSGLGMAIRLREAGVDDLLILEQEQGIGGTWRANTYPGAACDVESILYSFSFAPNPRWTETYACQAEILAYMQRTAQEAGLEPYLRFGQRVILATWEEERGRWLVETEGGDRYRARALISGCGPLSKPIPPNIPGLESFAGRSFHSSRWDHDHDLSGRVGVIGTGASAIQIVPHLAAQAASLTVFQRTPPWIVPHSRRPVTPFERRLYSFPPAGWLARMLTYWRLETRVLAFAFHPALIKGVERIARAHLRDQIACDELRKRVTPNYTIGCKRILLSNDYYPALQRPNVDLVTDPIQEVTPTGVRTPTGEHTFETLILATGFQASEAMAPFDVRGRGGRDLNADWRQGGEAHKGTTVAGYPNFFVLVGPNTGLGHTSVILMIESQIRYARLAVQRILRDDLRRLEVKAQAQEAYNKTVHARLAKTVWASGCESWYQTSSGKNTTLWPGFTFEFRLRLYRFDHANYDRVRFS
jgi:cation diffusion facilitator CzcD-associated flavoprotein CzcO